MRGLNAERRLLAEGDRSRVPWAADGDGPSPAGAKKVGGYSGVHDLELRCKYLLRVSDVPLGREAATININIDNDIDIDTFLPKPPPPPPPLLFRELLTSKVAQTPPTPTTNTHHHHRRLPVADPGFILSIYLHLQEKVVPQPRNSRSLLVPIDLSPVRSPQHSPPFSWVQLPFPLFASPIPIPIPILTLPNGPWTTITPPQLPLPHCNFLLSFDLFSHTLSPLPSVLPFLIHSIDLLSLAPKTEEEGNTCLTKLPIPKPEIRTTLCPSPPTIQLLCLYP
ncbi:hypothetical protein CDEST_01674 [Colletotrichum destructivum]|uniref:Uncharacterized protein n=1 Tax=Colletotrichum destructivum TaxID=34406 RepID=A0AAX4HZW6_9PEZI|nr:hypothetical protein CDEST_01674 [Colletotrichum destructivum]